MAVNKVVYGNNTLIDLCEDTVVADKLITGYTAHAANGEVITGTAELASAVVSGLVYQDQDGYLVLEDGAVNNTHVDEYDDVLFVDYDGKVLYSYNKTDFANLTALPANPTHAGLTAQGWNWSLADAKAHVASYGFLVIGQNYVSTDGKTHVHVSIGNDDPLDFELRLNRTSTGVFTIDWGDNSTEPNSSTTGTVLYSHTYTQPGEYEITINATSGSFNFVGTSAANSAFGSDVQAASCVRSIVFGNRTASIGGYAFCLCQNLETMTIPTTMTTWNNYGMRMCTKLKACVVPSGVTSIGTYFFQYDHKIKYIAIPNSVKTLSNYAFSHCLSLDLLCIPKALTTFGTNLAQYCFSLRKVNWPHSTVTKLTGSCFRDCDNLEVFKTDGASNIVTFATYCFYGCRKLLELDTSKATTIGTYAFQYCTEIEKFELLSSSLKTIDVSSFQYAYALRNITIPSGVTKINKNAFNTCYSLKEVHMLPTTPPTLADSTIFTTVHPEFKIYVPQSENHAVLDAYKAASNWSTWADKIEEEP